MRAIKNILLIFAFLMTLINCCKSQSNQYKSKLRPRVAAKLDSLYPNATKNLVESDSIQKLDINCHCPETVGMIILTFDTNGNLLNKEVHYYYASIIKYLPDTIVGYMNKNASSTVKFNSNNMFKRINNKGEILYGIVSYESPHSWSETAYTLWFKPSGELISKEEMPLAMR